jgi:uroporphyrinogen decarboxylase
MTNRERVTASLEHRQPDKTPYRIGFTAPIRARMAAFYGDPDFESKLGNALTTLSTELPGGWREVRPDIWEDEFGVQWDRSVDRDIGVVCNQMITPESLSDYAFPDPDDPRRWDRFPLELERNPGQFCVSNIGFSLFERAWTLCGMENLLTAMAMDPGFVHALLDRILEHNLARIEHACSFRIDAMMFGDDWGSQQGVLMGPQLWREFLKPRVRQMYAAAHARGKWVFIHSCGKVDALFDDLIECGLDCFNPFQPEVMNPFEMKRQYGDRLSFFGGISTQKTLPYATPSQVRDEVRRLLDEVGRNGGYIASPAHDTPGDARPENVAAMIEVLREQ